MRAKEAIAAFLLAFVTVVPAFPQAPLPRAVPSRQARIQQHSRLAQQYLAQQRPDLAIPELKAIVELDPKNLDARANLGVLLFFREQYADAAPQLRAALKLQPDLWKIQALLGLSELRLGQQAEGRHDLETAFPNLQEEKNQDASRPCADRQLHFHRRARPCGQHRLLPFET